jgi:PKD repeat protein
VLLVALLVGPPAAIRAADLVVDGQAVTITTNTVVDGSVWIQNGGVLTLRNATLTLLLDYDEEHHIDISDNSRFVVENGVVTSTGGQYWIELSGPPGTQPRMNVTGASSWITNHSGIRPYGSARVTVAGADVEELQVRDQVVVTVNHGATYPVFFFDGVTASLANLDTDTGYTITNTVSVPGGWSFALTNAWVEGYQVDVMNGANVSIASSDGIVLSVHTPGNLGSDLRIVEGVTSDGTISGSLTNLGSTVTFTNSNIALLNVYVFGEDRVLLRDVHVNEVNAEQGSELVVGQKGYATTLNCNLCQVYDHAAFTVVEATIDATDNLPSATSSYADFDVVGHGEMSFANMDLAELELTAREEGKLDLHACTNATVTVVDPTAQVGERVLGARFTPSRRSGAAPFAVDFLDQSGGTVTSYLWQFGDGTSSTVPEPTHVYSQRGLYRAKLTVSGPAGQHTWSDRDWIAVGLERLFRDGFETADTSAWSAVQP